MRPIREWRFHREPTLAGVSASPPDAHPGDIRSWRHVTTPHDFAIESLPPRGEDALALRNGSWRFRAGDDSKWASPGYEDHDWASMMAPQSCRAHDVTSQFVWLRRWFRVSPAQLRLERAGKLRLALGPISDADETFVNGVVVGKTGLMPADEATLRPWEPRIHPRDAGVCADALQYRSYPLPPHSLHGGEELVAVRVFASEARRPCGLVDPPGGADRRAGPFDPAISAGQIASGFTSGGVGVYTAPLPLSAREHAQAAAGELHLSLHFDGVYGSTRIWLNGVAHSHDEVHPQASSAPFACRLRRAALQAAPAPAHVTIRVASEGASSRWYTGAGLIRPVALAVLPPLHIRPLGGIRLVTVRLSGLTRHGRRAQLADVTVECTLHNAGRAPLSGTLHLSIARRGAHVRARPVVAEPRRLGPVDPDRSARVVFQLTLRHAALWSPESPALYRVDAALRGADGLADVSTAHIVTGLRRLRFDNASGFSINAQPLKLRGGNVHADHGPLGGRSFRGAERRRVRLLKSLGYNAVRTAHNPASSSFLDACDEMGMLVLAEGNLDVWDVAKTEHDYHTSFGAWWRRDVEAMLARDAHHPSIILWSIGNEIRDRHTPSQLRRARELARVFRSRDERPLMLALDQPSGALSDALFAEVDVAGYNYAAHAFAADHARHPSRLIISSESYPSRGHQVWRAVDSAPYVLGDFVWAAVDYLGEAAIGSSGFFAPDMRACAGRYGFCPQGWPYVASNCGDLDLVGHIKPSGRFRAVLFNASPLELTVGRPKPPGATGAEVMSKWGFPDESASWNGLPKHPGQRRRPLRLSTRVRVYSRCAAVDLQLNGRSVEGRPRVPTESDGLRLEYRVRFERGVLTAVCLDASMAPLLNRSLRTAGEAAALTLSAAPTAISLLPEEEDLAYVTASVVDAAGVVNGEGVHRVHFEVVVGPDGRSRGPDGDLVGPDGRPLAEIVAAGNGNPADPSAFDTGSCTTFRGSCVAIIRPLVAAALAARSTTGGNARSVRVRATASALAATDVVLQLTDAPSPKSAGGRTMNTASY